MKPTSKHDCELRRLILLHFAKLNADLTSANIEFIQSSGIGSIDLDSPAGRLLVEINAVVCAQSEVLTALLRSRLDAVDEETQYWLLSN